ncbi:MAG: hypothetical protein V5A39_13840 [Haloarculaceae archaeon]
MEIPHLVKERLGDEAIEAAVNLGDEDLVCVTPTRTLVYRGEGLLSDESASVFSHDVERLDISEGRRKTEFAFEYVDGTDSFTAPGNRTEPILKLLLGGILHVGGVIDDGESVSDVFSFSELTLVVTSDRLIKHVGAPVWDEDFEEYPYADVTGLSFEEGSVATQVVLSVDGRPDRIKAPTDEARKVERSLKQALFAYHDVDSLSALNEKLGRDETGAQSGDDAAGGSLSLESGISPLVSSDDEDSEASPTESAPDPGRAAGSAAREPATEGPGSGPESSSRPDDGGATAADSATATRSSGDTSVDTVSTSQPADETGGGVERIDPEDVEAMKSQLATLTKAVKKQNDRLRDQQETIDRLIEELRRGR